MAILNAESFDLYGTSSAALALRGYAINGAVVVSTTNPRTGTGCLLMGNTASSNRGFAFILPAAKDVVGHGAALRLESVPTATSRVNHGLGFGTGSDGFVYKVVHNADLGITAYSGSTNLGSSAPAIISTGTYYWLEAKMTDNTFGGGLNTGTLEVRLNGVQILLITGINITAQFSRVSLGSLQSNIGGGPTADVLFDDWVMWDDQGSYNTDFLGDRRCVTCYPNSDTAFADWTPSTGTTGYQMIDEATPSDADYIQANAVGNISEFGKQAIGLATNDVAGAVVIARALKADAGASSFSIGMHSGAFVQASADFNPNTTVAYFSQVFERDPNGDIQWTKTTLDAATIRFERTA